MVQKEKNCKKSEFLLLFSIYRSSSPRVNRRCNIICLVVHSLKTNSFKDPGAGTDFRLKLYNSRKNSNKKLTNFIFFKFKKTFYSMLY